ncbi:MAG: hypothetical protein ACOCXM_07925 [Myxococcota bacterium]
MRADRSLPLPAPWVLAAVSAAVSLGTVALVISQGGAGAAEPEPPNPAETRIDVTTPERAAESFLHAWYARDHDAALAMARGQARRAVLERRAEADRTTPNDPGLKRAVGDAMAQARFALRIRENESFADGRVAVRGIVEGELLGGDYRRGVSFLLARENDDRWVVQRMDLGDIPGEPSDRSRVR